MKRYNRYEFLTIEEEDVRNAQGCTIRFEKKGVEYEGYIEKALIKSNNDSFVPKSDNTYVERFMGIKVKMQNGEELKLWFNDITIGFIEF